MLMAPTAVMKQEERSSKSKNEELSVLPSVGVQELSKKQPEDIEKNVSVTTLTKGAGDEVETSDLENSSTSLANHHGEETTYPEGGRRAYAVVLGAFCAMLCGFGFMNTIGTFQAYISTHQLSQYSESAIGWILSLYIFLSFFCSAQIGPVFDIYGPKWLIAAGGICMVAGVLGLAASTEYWHFIFTFSLLPGIGSSLLFTPAISSIAHFFNRRRGLFTGLAATGGSLGGIIFSVSIPPLIARVGWPTSMRILACVLLVICTLATILTGHRQLPHPTWRSVFPSLRPFASSLPFTITTLGIFFLEWGIFVPLAYLPSYGLYRGSPLTNDLLALLNTASVLGRALPGYAADRLGAFNTMIATIILSLVAVLAIWLPSTLPVSTSSSSPNPTTLTVLEPSLICFALLFGFASGSNISLTPVCVGKMCRTSEYGRWYAACYMVVSFGCLTSVPIAGALLKACGGGYWGLVSFTGGCYGAGLLCFAVVRVSGVGWRLAAVY